VAYFVLLILKVFLNFNTAYTNKPIDRKTKTSEKNKPNLFVVSFLTEIPNMEETESLLESSWIEQ
jgi:hypothetical protein